MPGESAWPTSYDYNWCENTAQGQTKTGHQITTPKSMPLTGDEHAELKA